jgi:3-dehydroquinate dehydratase-2
MSTKKVIIINGPNLNLIGKRERTIYGELSFEEYLNTVKLKYTNLEIHYFQSNDEGEIIQKIHSANENFDGIIINPGAYGHTSLAIADAVAAIQIVCIEVHISNIYARENFRHYTLISAKCKGSISGFGLQSYELALNYFN